MRLAWNWRQPLVSWQSFFLLAKWKIYPFVCAAVRVWNQAHSAHTDICCCACIWRHRWRILKGLFPSLECSFKCWHDQFGSNLTQWKHWKVQPALAVVLLRPSLSSNLHHLLSSWARPQHKPRKRLTSLICSYVRQTHTESLNGQWISRHAGQEPTRLLLNFDPDDREKPPGWFLFPWVSPSEPNTFTYINVYVIMEIFTFPHRFGR